MLDGHRSWPIRGMLMSKAARLLASFWIALAIPVAAYAHTDPETGQDYRGFERNDGRGSCCDWHDCRPAFAPIMEPDGAKIEDRVRNKFDFDPQKVVKRPSSDGNWHVCGTSMILYCIIAPAESMRDQAVPRSRFSILSPPPSTGSDATPSHVSLVPIARDKDTCALGRR